MNTNAWHRADFTHDGHAATASAATALQTVPNASSERTPCRHQGNCDQRGDNSHLAKYSHPPTPCRYDPKCFNCNKWHRVDFTHTKQVCRYGADCRDQDSAEHTSKYDHPRRHAASPSSPSPPASSTCSASAVAAAASAASAGDDVSEAGTVASSARRRAACRFGLKCRNIDKPEHAARFTHRRSDGSDSEDADDDAGSCSGASVFPRYWSKMDKNAKFQMFECDEKFVQMIQRLVDNCTSRTMGHAKDQKVPGHYSKLVVESVYRIQNPPQWGIYALKRAQVQDCSQFGRPFHVDSYAPWMQRSELDSSRNEVFLFHGTDNDTRDLVIHKTLDERFCSRGAFGLACYLAESASKADQYCTPDERNRFHMLLFRVTMGRPFVIDELLKDLFDKRLAPVGFDCIVGRVRKDAFRETVIFDGDLTLPEFCIRYRRE